MKSYFTDAELKCPCCWKLVMDQDFLEKLNQARELAGFAFSVDSGYRCEKHNAEVGSTSTNHTRGKAADIICPDGYQKYVMVRSMIITGLLGIGIGKDFLHVDTNRTMPAIWTY
ncbi:MAG: hypothetical protein KJ954_14350 [Alphaproteobacteria bacterium]|nr:hypothetical protein [Alphaproteobacteria bacterium]